MSEDQLREHLRPVSVLDAGGDLLQDACGYSRGMQHRVPDLAVSFRRRQGIRRWTFFQESQIAWLGVQFTGWLARAEWGLCDLASGERQEQARVFPLERGLETAIDPEGGVALHHSDLGLSFHREGGFYRLRSDLPLRAAQRMRVDLTVRPEAELRGDYVARLTDNRFIWQYLRPAFPVQGQCISGKRNWLLTAQQARAVEESYVARLPRASRLFSFSALSAQAQQPSYFGHWLRLPDGTVQCCCWMKHNKKLAYLSDELVWNIQWDNLLLPWELEIRGRERVMLQFQPLSAGKRNPGQHWFFTDQLRSFGNFEVRIGTGARPRRMQLRGWADLYDSPSLYRPG
ncbi:MAG: DUF2804 family protein [Leptospirales bacterium]|nr:DUF2804 family protein [Leptospirales bacterium]